MDIREALLRVMEHPELRIYLAGYQCLKVAPTGRLKSLIHVDGTYARLTAHDLLATTWQTYTDAQLAQIFLELEQAGNRTGRDDDTAE